MVAAPRWGQWLIVIGPGPAICSLNVLVGQWPIR